MTWRERAICADVIDGSLPMPALWCYASRWNRFASAFRVVLRDGKVVRPYATGRDLYRQALVAVRADDIIVTSWEVNAVEVARYTGNRMVLVDAGEPVIELEVEPLDRSAISAWLDTDEARRIIEASQADPPNDRWPLAEEEA